MGAAAAQHGPPVALEQSRLVHGTAPKVNQITQDTRAAAPVPARIVASSPAGPGVRPPQLRTASRGVAAAATRVSSPSTTPVVPKHAAAIVSRGPAASAPLRGPGSASGNRTFYAPWAAATASVTAPTTALGTATSPAAAVATASAATPPPVTATAPASAVATAAAATPPPVTTTAPASAVTRPQFPRVCQAPSAAHVSPCLASDPKPAGAVEGVAWASAAHAVALQTSSDAQASPTSASETTLPPTCSGDLGFMNPRASDTTLPPSCWDRSHDSPRHVHRHSIDTQASPAAASDTTLPPAWGMSPDAVHTMPTEDLRAETEEADFPMEVRTVVKLVCPDCGDAFLTLDDVKSHWFEAHAQTAQCESAEVTQSTAEDGCRRIVRQICPDCAESFATVEEAQAHWLQVHRHQHQRQQQEQQHDEQQREQQQSIEDVPAAAPHMPEVERAQLVEADESGQPLIVRRTDPETGAATTVVMDQDGATRSFGLETVKSMTLTDESEIASWIQAMKDHHVRGLVNEIRERLYESSGKLQTRREELDQLSKRLSYDYFGLSEGARGKDVDNAYRRLARSMHPDKNGGTTEAKQRFQAMKERYEDLKTQLAAEQLRAAPPPQDPAGSSEEGCDEKAEAEEAEPGAEEESSRQANTADPETEPAKSGSEDQRCGRQPIDANSEMAQATAGTKVSRPSRDEAEASAWKMLRQLKMINQNMKIVESDFQRVQSEVELLRGAT